MVSIPAGTWSGQGTELRNDRTSMSSGGPSGKSSARTWAISVAFSWPASSRAPCAARSWSAASRTAVCQASAKLRLAAKYSSSRMGSGMGCLLCCRPVQLQHGRDALQLLQRDFTPPGHRWHEPVCFQRSQRGGFAGGQLNLQHCVEAQPTAIALAVVMLGVDPELFRAMRRPADGNQGTAYLDNLAVEDFAPLINDLHRLLLGKVFPVSHDCSSARAKR